MSLINQMLQDLEKRRASASERGALPSQVRVLPHSEKTNVMWWFAAIAIVCTALAAWQIFQSRNTEQANASPAQGGGEKYLAEGPASRLALELAQAPQVPARAANVSAVASAAAIKRATSAPSAGNANKLPVATSAVVTVDAGASQSNSMQKPNAAASESKPAVAAVVAAVATSAVSTKPRTIDVSADTRVQSAPANSQIDKRMQQLTPAQLAENEYREAANALSQGRIAEAQELFRQAVQHNPAHIGARQGLFGLLIDAKRSSDAELLLKEGLKLNPNQPGFAMALARLQLDRGDATGAIETLQGSAAGAQNSPDYLAFYAALLQRQTRHREAVEQYQAALRLAPQSGVWLMGLGISLQSLNRNAEAQEAFRRAKNSNSLNPELQAFVDQRLRQLQ